MTNFEKITALPEVLGEFLASLPVATGPWDKEFHRMFCDSCERENCDGKRCPHNAERGNPAWWLKLGGKPGEVPGLSIRVKAAFPILWGREYYTVAEKKKETHAPCVCCDNTGKVTIKGVQYDCPRCKGNWRERGCRRDYRLLRCKVGAGENQRKYVRLGTHIQADEQRRAVRWQLANPAGGSPRHGQKGLRKIHKGMSEGISRNNAEWMADFMRGWMPYGEAWRNYFFTGPAERMMRL